MGKIYVNQNRGHSSYKWLLVFPQWGCVELVPKVADPFGWCFFLYGSVRSSLSPVLTLFLAHTCLFKTLAALGVRPKFIRISQEGYTLPFRKRPILARFPGRRSCSVPWIIQMESSGTTLTSLSQGSGYLQGCLLLHTIQPIRKY